MGLRELLDRIGHLVEKGGKYEKFHAIYEAIDTFHFRPASQETLDAIIAPFG